MKIGYLRISTKEQNEERQRHALLEIGVPNRNIYIDKQTGTNFDREEYSAMKDFILDTLRKEKNEDITVYFKELDRLGRNYKEIKKELEWFTDRNISLKFLDMEWLDVMFENNDNEMMAVIRDTVMNFMSYIAEAEVKKMKQRQREAIDLIKADPVLRAEKYRGRKPIDYPENWEQFYKLYKNNSLKAVDCMKLMNLKKTTFYKLLKKYENNLNGGEA